MSHLPLIGPLLSGASRTVAPAPALPPVPVPTPPPAVADPSVAAAAQAQATAAAQAAGRQSTLHTSGLGDSSAAVIMKARLLGG